MNESSARDALKQLSALGAGVLLAATPHCGGKSESAPGDDSGGRARGGASGSAGYGGVGAGAYGGSYGGSVGTGGVGAYGGSYGGSVGTGGVGAYGGSAGTGGCSATTICLTPVEIESCHPDAGVDGGDAGAPGEGGFGGEANVPVELGSPGEAPGFVDAGVGIPVDAGADGADVTQYACPTSFPSCELPLPPFARVDPPTWNGVACCYPISWCAL